MSTERTEATNALAPLFKSSSFTSEGCIGPVDTRCHRVKKGERTVQVQASIPAMWLARTWVGFRGEGHTCMPHSDRGLSQGRRGASSEKRNELRYPRLATTNKIFYYHFIRAENLRVLIDERPRFACWYDCWHNACKVIRLARRIGETGKTKELEGQTFLIWRMTWSSSDRIANTFSALYRGDRSDMPRLHNSHLRFFHESKTS